LGLIVSNQPISYFKIALKYSFLNLIDYCSPVLIQVENMIQLKMKETTPNMINQMAYFPMALTISSVDDNGEKESATSPKIYENKGIVRPFATAAIKPIIINILSLREANLKRSVNLHSFGFSI